MEVEGGRHKKIIKKAAKKKTVAKKKHTKSSRPGPDYMPKVNAIIKSKMEAERNDRRARITEKMKAKGASAAEIAAELKKPLFKKGEVSAIYKEGWQEARDKGIAPPKQAKQPGQRRQGPQK